MILFPQAIFFSRAKTVWVCKSKFNSVANYNIFPTNHIWQHWWSKINQFFYFLGQQHVFNCLKKIGFSDECSKIWQFNIKNTRSKCFEPCIIAWITNEPLNNDDGTLNNCIQCDEDISGPNFKYFSGRTRRNSGIPSAIYRPPNTIYNMTHCYWYGDLSY